MNGLTDIFAARVGQRVRIWIAAGRTPNVVMKAGTTSTEKYKSWSERGVIVTAGTDYVEVRPDSEAASIYIPHAAIGTFKFEE